MSTCRLTKDSWLSVNSCPFCVFLLTNLKRERVRKISASFGARSEFFRPCDKENYSLRVKDWLSFRGFLKYCLVQSCIICRKIKVNKHCEIFYFSFGCLKGCSGYYAYVLESQMREEEVSIQESREKPNVVHSQYIYAESPF